ncbi:MAG: phage tail protein, partial [Ardenticatenales bacterium]|nr:phage tail protein [Ardenticatenales bacterium]
LGKIDDARANMTVTMYDRNYTPVMHWNFRNAWPSKLAGPTLDSGSGEFSVEDMTIQHEGMNRDGSDGFPV